MRHKHTTISVLTEDHPGVLSRLSGLVSRRGYNVNSLSVGRTHQPGLSRFTLVVGGDDVPAAPMLFFKPNTRMLFGDAKATVHALVSEFKSASD